MKKKLHKIMGVGLTLVLLASLFGFAVPVAAAAGNMQWAGQPLPSATGNVLVNGSDVTDIAITNDGSTIYAIDGASAAGAVYRSADAGQSFTLVAAPAAVTLTSIAVAPDDVNAIAVTDGTLVYTSSNGGSTWATLPALPAVNLGATIMDVAVGPLRTGTLLGREYAVAVAEPLNANTTRGDVLIIGATATWVSAATVAPAITGTNDYMAVVFTPNFIGDRCLVAVGFPSPAGAKLQIINTATSTVVRTTAFPAAGATTTDYQTVPVFNNVVAADIALPSDFDPTTSTGQRSYVSIAAQATFTDNDAYRIDAGSSRSLGAVSALPLKSVAFNGTIDEGILFVGYNAATTVKYTIQPTVSLPTWGSCKKNPTGTGATVVRVAADYATTSRVFAATGGLVASDDSALSVSNNAGVSFDQESLIDIGDVTPDVGAIQDMALTPDGSTIFLASRVAATARVSLWKSTAPPSPTSWSRVWCIAGTTGIVRLNPGWTDAPAIYFADLVLNGSIYYSSNGGDIFATRLGPTGVTITDLAVEDANTVYVSFGANVYKSTSSAWTWGLPKSSLAGAITSLNSAKVDHLLVGGTGACSYSLDGGSTFTKISTGLNAADTLIICPDEDYDTNNIIYAGDSSGTTNNLYRFEIGTSSAWEDILNPTAAPIVGLEMNNGALYSMSAAACDRTLGPHDAAGTIAWRTMDANAPAAVASFAAVDNMVFAANAATSMWAYDDWLATAKPVISSPGDGYDVAVNPVTGNAVLVMLSWEPMGSSTGLVNTYLVAIWKTEAGIAGATFLPTGALAIPTAPSVDLVTGGTLNFTMLANTEYTWMVRARDEVSGDLINSQWSAPRTLKVQAGVPVAAPYVGPVLFSPVHGSMDAPLRPGFSWGPIPGATKYEFELSTKSGTTARGYFVDALVGLTGANALDSTSWQCDIDLDYSTTYYWHVKVSAPTETPWVTGVFTTAAAPVAPPAPTPPVTVPPAPAPITPAWIWAIVIIGAVLVIAVIVLIVTTRRVP